MTALVAVQPNVPPMSINDVERVALAIAKGGLFGSSDPHAVLTLCLLAQAEGQHPAVVFRDYHIIKGKPAKKADAMLRDFVNAGGRVEWHALDDAKADATFSHPSGGTVRIDGLLDRALRMGDFETCADPRAFIRAEAALFDACADAIGYEAADGYASARDCALTLVTSAMVAA